MPYPSKTYKTEAIVLRHYPIGEADYLLVLYTPGKGKVRAVAKGARRIKSKLGGHVEPPMRTSLFLSRGQNLDSVGQAEALEGFRPLREDLHRLSQALYMLELVDAFSQEGPGKLSVISTDPGIAAVAVRGCAPGAAALLPDAAPRLHRLPA